MSDTNGDKCEWCGEPVDAECECKEEWDGCDCEDMTEELYTWTPAWRYASGA